mgnify:CR=1 FL=1
MNVVFFMQDTGAVFGAERATIDLAHGLRAAGDVPRFFLIEEARLAGPPSALRDAIEQQGFAVTAFPVRGRLSMSLARSVRAAMTSAGGDVLHVAGYKANLHAWLAGIRPRVATVHGWLFRNDPKERLYDAIDRWCLRRCDRVICLSRHYEQLLRDAGVKENRLLRIPSGLREIPIAAEVAGRRHRAPGAPITFGMMGRFSEEKNHRRFLDAAQQVLRRHPAARFLIAGQGPLEPAIRAMAAARGLGDLLQFRGYMPVAEFMSLIDAYVICSRIENLPYSIMEAMAWGVPVIGTSVGGIPDLVEDGVTGWLVSAADDDGLAKAMEHVLADPAAARRKGDVGRAVVMARHTLEVAVAAHQQMYREVVR